MHSYADAVREELLECAVKRPCCRNSLVRGLLLNGIAREQGVTVYYKHEATAAFAAKEIRRRFGKMPTIDKESSHGHSKWVLQVSSAALKMLEETQNGGSAEEIISCEGCRSALLRGAFLACATMNDPQKSTHLEFLTGDAERAVFLSSFLSALGYAPREIQRTNGVGLYFKDASSVEDVVALTGAVKSSLEIMNLRIEREIRNQENRATNCVAKNIEKSVSASAKQMNAIEKLTVSGMLAQLPESIRLTARLRAENPDASLEELRNLHVPPITKSGLNHRLQKLLAEAEKLD